MISKIRTKLRYTFIHNIFIFFRYTLHDVLVIRMYRSMLRGYYKKALTYPFKSLVNRIKGRPKTVVIDIVSVCNLRCPLCSVPPDIARESTQKKHIDIDAYRDCGYRVRRMQRISFYRYYRSGPEFTPAYAVNNTRQAK